MATGQGTATIDFGTIGGTGSNTASAVITGLTSISSTSKVESYVMSSDSTVDHTTNDHRYFALLAKLTCEDVIAGTGFTIYATSLEKLSGQFQVRWVWAD